MDCAERRFTTLKRVDCGSEVVRRVIVFHPCVGRQARADHECLAALAASIESPAPERLCCLRPAWNDELRKDQDACRCLRGLLLNESGGRVIVDGLRDIAEM